LPAIRVFATPLRRNRKNIPSRRAAPNFADYIALGGFYWPPHPRTLPLLERDDRLRDWLDRGFNLYGGRR
jgi:hypothetical protein